MEVDESVRELRGMEVNERMRVDSIRESARAYKSSLRSRPSFSFRS